MSTPYTFTDKRGRSLVIRRVCPADAEALIRFIQDTDTESTFLTREPGEFVMALETERRFLAHVDGRSNALYLTAWDAGVLVATLDFHGGNRLRTAHAGEMGLCVREAYSGSGLGGHLVDLLIAWARRTPGVTKLKLRVQAGNARALALYRARGFSEEGRFKAELRIDGQEVDVLAMALFTPDDAG